MCLPLVIELNNRWFVSKLYGSKYNWETPVWTHPVKYRPDHIGLHFFPHPVDLG